MCGFCGEISFGEYANVNAIRRMLTPLKRRGPDSVGVFSQDKIGFGHRRLSILGLAASSNQPMVDPQLGLAIVFNGCIYNFRELKKDLVARGHSFFRGEIPRSS